MASFTWVSVAALAIVAAGAAAAAVDPPACAADEEGDGVGLLQSTGRGAKVGSHSHTDPSGGWVNKTLVCPVTATQCGTGGCCPILYTCDGGTTCKSTLFGKKTEDPTPAELKCPIAYSDHGDKGCCPPAKLLGPSDTCLAPTCENTLEYGCGGTPGVSAGTPTCTPGGTVPAGTTIVINGVTPEASETCELNGKTCVKLTVGETTIPSAPDCN